MLGFLQNIGMSELLIILAILVLIFGATKIPQIARSMGKSVSEFKKGIHESSQEVKDKKDGEEKNS